MDKKNLTGLTADEIFHFIGDGGFNYLHALSISTGIYKKRISDFSDLKKIPGKLRDFLKDNALTGITPPLLSETSSDGTVKYLFSAPDGKMFETVYIPDDKRNTVCVSSQSGCRMGCSFCATAGYGFHGNLSAGEIVSQVLSIPDSEKITHVVVMGMGEPLDNPDNVLKACRILTSEWGLAISPRNVTVSTVGLSPALEEFLRGCDCNLTLSLFSPFSSERAEQVPVERICPVRNLLELMKGYPVKKKRRLSIAYVMIKDLNDTEKHLEELKALLKGSGIRVNLLPYHPAGQERYISSSAEKMNDFKHRLVISGIPASIRRSRGVDISAACGLLVPPGPV
jgi:23S rRNA (adenine2503-C2)-methyltransferase